jgi:hypothetical protein
MPAFFERTLVQFDTISVSDPTQYFIGGHNGLLLGIPTVLALMYAIWRYKSRIESSLLVCSLLLVGYFFALPISQSIWGIVGFSKLVQFPYRFLSIPVLFGPWIVAYALENLSGWKKYISIGICAIVWIYASSIQIQQIVYVDRQTGYYTTNEDTTTVHAEYLPRWVTHPPLYRAQRIFEFTSGDAEANANSLTTQTIDLSIVAKQTSVLQINKLYYPGWGITIDGILAPIDYKTGDGTMHVEVASGNHRVVATFRETVARFFADLVTLASAGIYLWIVVAKKSRRRI